MARDSRLLLGYLSTSVGIPSFFSYNVDVGVRKKTEEITTVTKTPQSLDGLFLSSLDLFYYNI